MDALISLVYTIIDSVCVCLFLDAFASHRWRDHRFLVGVIVQTILMYASIEFSVIALNRNQIVKIFLILLSCFIVARTLYENISGRFLLFLIVVEYLLTYSLSFTVGMLATSVCGMDAQTFQADKALSLIYGISYYSAELFIIALFRKMMLQRMGNRPRSDAQHSQLILYFLFPCASFVMLVILLYVTSGHNIEEFVSAGCCILIFISNVAVLFLLERMEYAASEREQLLMLNQQIQLQSKNMTSASELYSAQRKKVHDFRAHLNILNQLMKNQEYSAAEEYLEKITEQQTDRLFLVNTHHPIFRKRLYSDALVDVVIDVIHAAGNWLRYDIGLFAQGHLAGIVQYHGVVQGDHGCNIRAGICPQDIEVTQAVGLFCFHAAGDTIPGDQGCRDNKMIFYILKRIF